MILLPVSYGISEHDNLAVSVESAAAQLRLGSFYDDGDVIEGYIRAATERLESYCRMLFLNGVVEEQYVADTYCTGFELTQLPPLRDIVVERLVDNVWTALTAEEYTAVPEKFMVRIFLRDIPITYDEAPPYNFRVTYSAGYGLLDDQNVPYELPATIQLAIKMLVASMYTSRGDCSAECGAEGIPRPIKCLLGKFKRPLIGMVRGGRPMDTGRLCAGDRGVSATLLKRTMQGSKVGSSKATEVFTPLGTIWCKVETSEGVPGRSLSSYFKGVNTDKIITHAFNTQWFKALDDLDAAGEYFLQVAGQYYRVIYKENQRLEGLRLIFFCQARGFSSNEATHA